MAGLILPHFEDPNVSIVHPPKMDPRNAVRPGVRFYSQFNVLTDCMTWRTDSITPEQLATHYRNRVWGAKDANGGLVEHAWDDLLKTHFASKAVAVEELANPKPMTQKKYLRKAGALDSEYRRLAERLGVEGQFDTREWLAIEGHKYLCRPVVV